MATARKLPSGRWRVRVPDVKTEKGWKYRSFTADTKAEAEFLAMDYQKNHNQQAIPTWTLRTAYHEYIEAKAPVLSPNTTASYSYMAERDFPELMPKKLKDITLDDIQRAVSHMALSHSPKSVRNAHGLLSAVMRAYRPDFSMSTTLPQKIKPTLCVPTDSDIKRIWDYLKGRALEIPFLLAAFGPLRRSEICALTWADLCENTITVNKALAHHKDKGWVVKPPKTGQGYRTIDLPQFVVDAIRAKEPHSVTADTRICAINPTTLTGYWEAAKKKLDLDPAMRFHDLRHYCASRMHAMGIPDQYICARGGWTLASLQNIYQHTLRDQITEFSEKTNSAFSEFFT